MTLSSQQVVELNFKIRWIVQYGDTFGLQLNIAKTKILLFSKTVTDIHLNVNENLIEVNSVKCLRSNINNQCNLKLCPMSWAQNGNGETLHLLCLALWMRKLNVKCSEKRLEAFEMYIYRKILQILWVQNISNIEVLNCVQSYWTQSSRERFRV